MAELIPDHCIRVSLGGLLLDLSQINTRAGCGIDEKVCSAKKAGLEQAWRQNCCGYLSAVQHRKKVYAGAPKVDRLKPSWMTASR